MPDNVLLPGTGQSIATKSDPNGNEFQEIMLVDGGFQIQRPASQNDISEKVEANLLTTEDGIGLADLILKLTNRIENLRVQVDLPVNLKQEPDGGLLLADMKGPFNWISKDATQPFVIDCTGYQTIIVQKSTTGVVTPYASNDQQNWIQTMALSVVGSAALSTTLVTAAGIYILPVVSKYLKLVGPASAIQCTIFLSIQPFNPQQTISNEPTNITQLGGQPIVMANVNGMAAVGGNIAPGAAPTAYPLLMGGQDALKTPLTRTMLMDILGRVQIGTHPGQYAPGIRMLNYDPSYRNILEVQDTSLSSDDMQNEKDLLYNILVELRVTNWYLKEGFAGTPLQDEPSEIRNDATMIRQ
jgi:hypothetical protein